MEVFLGMRLDSVRGIQCPSGQIRPLGLRAEHRLQQIQENGGEGGVNETVEPYLAYPEGELYSECKRLRARVAELEVALPAAGRLAGLADIIKHSMNFHDGDCGPDCERCTKSKQLLEADIAAVRAVTGGNE